MDPNERVSHTFPYLLGEHDFVISPKQYEDIDYELMNTRFTLLDNHM